MEKNKVQNDKVHSDNEISNEDLDKVAGGTGTILNDDGEPQRKQSYKGIVTLVR